MISICTVILDDCASYLPIYKDSILKKTKLVSEVLMAKVDASPEYNLTYFINGIKFIEFGVAGKNRLAQGVEHGIGLHECIEKASNDYLLFHDPDVFYYTSVDEFFYNLMSHYHLDLVGISHCASLKFAYTYFPYLSNLLLKKSKLPPLSWLEGEIFDEEGVQRDGKYLIRMDSSKYKSLFPNPKGDFDTGSFLWLWAHQNNWKWLSFQTLDVHNYTPKYYRNNINLKEKLGTDKFLYHATSSTAQNPGTFRDFQEAWNNSLLQQ